MGLDRVNAEMLLFEAAYKPITGKVLTIGRQTIGLTAPEAKNLILEYGLPLLHDAGELDSRTVGWNQAKEYITDISFFKMFSNAEVHALDVIDYEGAEVICDLNSPISHTYKENYDFIVNGSCLDNIFDPATSIKNISELLKPGGRVYHFEWGNSHAAAYLKFSPDWFLDYYAINNFKDCKVYIRYSPNSVGVNIDGTKTSQFAQRSSNALEIFHFDPLRVINGIVGYDDSNISAFGRWYVEVIAEKGQQSTSGVSPIQKHYRPNPEAHQPYIDSVQSFQRSRRPLFSRPSPYRVNNFENISDRLRCVATY